MSAFDRYTAPLVWRRSRFCNGASACVEVASLPDGGVVLRDGKDPHGPELRFTRQEWLAFTEGVRDGEFDLSALVGDERGGDARARASEAATAGVEPPPVSV